MTKTTTTYYCDRCGEEIVENSIFYCSTHLYTAIQIWKGEWKYADLCNKCKESFKAWWEKPSASLTETAESEEKVCLKENMTK